MHRYSSSVFLAIMIAVGVATAARGGDQTYTLRAEQQLVDDSRPAEAPSRNFRLVQRSDGRWIVLLGVDAKNHTYIKILQERAEGRFEVRHVVHGDAVASAHAILGVTALDRDRALADVHVNPSTGIGLLIDFTHLERSRAYLGVRFTWNRGSRHLAYFLDPPHFRGPDAPVWTELYVDGKSIRRFDGCIGERITWQKDGSLIVRLKRPGGETESHRVVLRSSGFDKAGVLTQRSGPSA